MAANPPGFIISALTTGNMAPMAEGVNAADKETIASYISNVKEPPASFHDTDSHLIWGDGLRDKPLDASKCPTAAAAAIDPARAGNWQGWGNGPESGRFQPTPGLDAASVPRLKLKWAFRYAGAKNGQATLIGDRLFVTATSGAVYALDAATGCVHWRYAAPAATRSSVAVVTLPGGRHALFIADWTKEAVALDADTGAVIWKTTIDDQPAEQMTGAPAVWDGKLYVRSRRAPKPSRPTTDGMLQVPRRGRRARCGDRQTAVEAVYAAQLAQGVRDQCGGQADVGTVGRGDLERADDRSGAAHHLRRDVEFVHRPRLSDRRRGRRARCRYRRDRVGQPAAAQGHLY